MDQETLLREAMRRHGGAVYRLALCRLQRREDAEDVYQDVFLRLLSQPFGEWEEERLKAWLLRAALNRCADVGRFRLRHPVLALEDLPEDRRPGEEAWAVWEAVGRLPKDQRMAVHLHYAEGYSTEEIAAMTGCAPATVRTRLSRARAKLRKLLGGFDDEA